MSNPPRILPYIALTLILGGQLLYADVTAGVLGTVVDPSGAAIPHATVTLKNPDTGLTRHAETDASGNYEFLSVPVGENYSIQAESLGFRTIVQSDIKLLVNQKYRADFKLVVGAVNERIEVSTSSAQVDTSSTQLGDVIESKKIATAGQPSRDSNEPGCVNMYTPPSVRR